MGDPVLQPVTKSRGETCICLAICLAVVLAWFSPWWAGGRVLAPLDLMHEMMQPWRGGGEAGVAKNHFISDAIDVVIPYHVFAAESYRTEGWVGWNDLTYGGTAQYANTMALYDDWSMQLYRWFDFWTAWHLGIMGQMLLAAWGMVLFLRGRGANIVWSTCGALIFAGNSQFVTWIDHRFTLGPFCWLPWIFWVIDHYRRGRSIAWGAVPALIALAFLGGTLQHVAMVALAVAACWGEEAWELWKRTQSLGRWVPQFRVLGRYALWGILGAGIAGLMLIPCTNALITSNKLGLHTGLFANAKQGIYPGGSLQPLLNLAAYPLQIFPSILGRCNSIDLLKLFKSDLFFIAYIGSLPTLIAFLAVGRKETRTLPRLLLLIGLLLPLTPAVRFLYQRLLFLFLLGGTIAFVNFMMQSTDATRKKVCKFTSWAAGVAATIWLAGSEALLLLGQGFLAPLHDKILAATAGSSFGGCRAWLEMRATNFVGDLFVWSPQQAIPLMLFALALWGLGWTTSRINTHRRLGSLILATAVVLEVSVFGARWVVWSDPVKYPIYPETPEVVALKEHVGRYGRITTLIHPTEHMSRTPFIPNTVTTYGIASIVGYDSVVPNGMVIPNNIPNDPRKIGRFGVTHLITWPGNPDVPKEWKFVWKSPSMELYENPFALPRYVDFASDANKDHFFAGGGEGIQTLTESTGLRNWREIAVPAGVRWIRVAENEDDGWEYRISSEGTWKPVLRAFDASMLMLNTESAHPVTLQMRYRPPLRRIGFAVSGVSLLLAALSSVGIARFSHSTPAIP